MYDDHEMPEYVIHAKVKNNLMLKRILEVSPNVAQFCKMHNLSASKVGEMINMKSPAMSEKSGEWYKYALDLAEALCVSPGELFTEEQRMAELKTNEAYVEVTKQQILCSPDPKMVLEHQQLAEKILEASTLTDREKLALKLRFEDEMSLEDAGKVLDVTRERFRQIETKALRKLRGTVGKNRKELLGSDVWDGDVVHG